MQLGALYQLRNKNSELLLLAVFLFLSATLKAALFCLFWPAAGVFLKIPKSNKGVVRMYLSFAFYAGLFIYAFSQYVLSSSGQSPSRVNYESSKS